ncbi:MAG: L,D-transpeptidase family protein [Pseudomonadales bacterium]|nr:L,D-transpeptidase family protein [Pseudomonadales bacterium]
MIPSYTFRLLILPLCIALATSLTGCESVSSTHRKGFSRKNIVTPVAQPTRADRIVVDKARRTLTAYAGQQVMASYQIALGRNPVGAKNCRGDFKTPEGRYKIVGRNPNSNYYRSLQLNYPNAEDVAHAQKLGCDPGSNIVIHGLENGYDWVGRTHRSVDWTSGCVAVTNQEMDRLWQITPVGTPVEIRP